MIISPSPHRWRAGRPHAAPVPVPQRRRVIVIGATEAGVSAAFHLGDCALLIEARGGGECAGSGVSVEERRAISATAAPRRWELPELTTQDATEQKRFSELVGALVSLTCGETRLGVRVTAIDTDEHVLRLSTGESFVYDKLVSTLRLEDFQRLMVDAKLARSYSTDSWRYWLNGRDVELLDLPTQLFFGDTDGQAAGKRVAGNVHYALVEKYSRHPEARAEKLFRPRIVGG
jgi:hypothetical protein